jgi:hypothetical protein
MQINFKRYVLSLLRCEACSKKKAEAFKDKGVRVE